MLCDYSGTALCRLSWIKSVVKLTVWQPMQFCPFVVSCCHCKSQVLGFSHRCLSKSLCSEQMSITINSSRFAKGSCYHCLLEYNFKMLSLGLPHNYCDKTQLCWILQNMVCQSKQGEMLLKKCVTLHRMFDEVGRVNSKTHIDNKTAKSS